MSSGGEQQNQLDDIEIREQDRLLPIANVARIMKCALPDNAKIAKDSKETIQECVSEFILFITSEASDRCMQEKRKTINGEDILWALTSLGFENYVDPLRLFLAKYRETQKLGQHPPHLTHEDLLGQHAGLDFSVGPMGSGYPAQHHGIHPGQPQFYP